MKNYSNKIYVVSTPIGNLEDITLRAINILKKVDKIVCEDTRISKKLLNYLGISKQLISYNKFNEQEKMDYIFSLLEDGDIALISDAGTPLIADPGYLIIKKCLESGVKVEAIPGCSSVIAALSIAGIPSNNFTFLGFLDKSSKIKQELFKSYLKKGLTLIAFETPHRFIKTLQDLKSVYGEDQEIVVARELTKMFEEVKKDQLSNIIKYYQESPIKGEIVLLWHIYQTKEVNLEHILLEKIEQIKNGNTKELAKNIAEEYQLNKTKVYDEIIKLKNQF